MKRHLFPTDGPNAGSKLKLERWQALFLTALEDEGKPIIALRAASQVGKTLLALGVALRSACDGRGVCWPPQRKFLSATCRGESKAQSRDPRSSLRSFHPLGAAPAQEHHGEIVVSTAEDG